MIYDAIALSNRYPNGRKAGNLSVENGRIVFKSELGEISWFLSDIKFSVGGTGNELIFIKHKTDSGITLYTNNKKILKDPNIKDSIETYKNLQEVKKHFHLKGIIWVIIGLILLSPFVLLFTYRSQIVNKIASKVPLSVEQKAGDQLFSLLSKNYKIINDTVLNKQFKTILTPLLKVVENRDFKFSFYIINDTTVNAFALPGGKVVVNSGLILKSDNWSEIQGVLAHEISHVTCRHHVRSIINNKGLFFLISVVFGGYSDLISVISGYGSSLESLMYSRRFEYEADNSGFDYLVKANINPEGMIDFFKKLEKMYSSGENSVFYKMISTHPGTADRIKNLEHRIKDTHKEEYIKENISLKEFQQRLKTNLKP